MATQTIQVTLNPGQSKPVSFSVTPTVPEGLPSKTYYVNVDGLTGTFVAVQPVTPAEFVVSNLVISPSKVYVGNPVTISVTVTNVGGETGTATITLEVT